MKNIMENLSNENFMFPNDKSIDQLLAENPLFLYLGKRYDDSLVYVGHFSFKSFVSITFSKEFELGKKYKFSDSKEFELGKKHNFSELINLFR